MWYEVRLMASAVTRTVANVMLARASPLRYSLQRIRRITNDVPTPSLPLLVLSLRCPPYSPTHFGLSFFFFLAT